MRTRVMPKGLQIFMFKKLFMKWNADYRYDPSAEMDNIDWDMVVDDTQTFHENLEDLENNYPEYFWFDMEKEERRVAEEQESRLDEVVDRAESQREVEAEVDNHVHPEAEEGVEPENPEGWQTEQTDDGELQSIEVEIEPHRTRAKGKQYLYGRIQLSVSQNWIGLTDQNCCSCT